MENHCWVFAWLLEMLDEEKGLAGDAPFEAILSKSPNFEADPWTSGYARATATALLRLRGGGLLFLHCARIMTAILPFGRARTVRLRLRLREGLAQLARWPLDAC
jgi:hypothetical protein